MPKMLQQFFWLLWLQPNTKQITILYAAARSPEVKMGASKVRLQMVNEKYNYFRLHALCKRRHGNTENTFPTSNDKCTGESRVETSGSSLNVILEI